MTHVSASAQLSVTVHGAPTPPSPGPADPLLLPFDDEALALLVADVPPLPLPLVFSAMVPPHPSAHATIEVQVKTSLWSRTRSLLPRARSRPRVYRSRCRASARR
jgi:hypothetical protein